MCLRLRILLLPDDYWTIISAGNVCSIWMCKQLRHAAHVVRSHKQVNSLVSVCTRDVTHPNQQLIDHHIASTFDRTSDMHRANMLTQMKYADARHERCWPERSACDTTVRCGRFYVASSHPWWSVVANLALGNALNHLQLDSLACRAPNNQLVGRRRRHIRTHTHTKADTHERRDNCHS